MREIGLGKQDWITFSEPACLAGGASMPFSAFGGIGHFHLFT